MSTARVGWKWTNAHTFLDDLGAEWCTLKDPPIAIASAMARTVRRIRLNEIAQIHTDLVPSRPDTGGSQHGRDDIVVDFANVLSPIVRRGRRAP